MVCSRSIYALQARLLIHSLTDSLPSFLSQPSDLNLSVHSLKSRDGAILDLDDILSHADDREQVSPFCAHSLSPTWPLIQFSLQLIASLLDEFPDGGRYAKSSLSHSYSHKGGQPTSAGIYGEANAHAPTHLANNSSSEASSRSTLNRNYRRSGDPLPTANGSAHSMSHYGQLGVRAEPIYGRTSTEQYQYAFHLQQRQHQRNSVTDSLLSSNDSPDPVLLSDQHLGEANYGERRNGDAGHHQRSGSYSSAQVNGYKSGPSFHLPPPPPPHCRNGAAVTPAISIVGSGGSNSRHSNFPISRSYDPKYGPRLHDEPHFSESADVVEITEENISLYATTTANRSSHVPALHVRHGSDPALDAVRQGNSREHPANGFAKSLHLNDPSSKRWSTAIAVDHSLPSRLHPPASSLVSDICHCIVFFCCGLHCSNSLDLLSCSLTL